MYVLLFFSFLDAATSCLRQDVLLICCTADWISQNHVLASCRMVLRSQNVLGLNRAPCLAVFLERLPLLLQEQYNYERVCTRNCFPKKRVERRVIGCISSTSSSRATCQLGISWSTAPSSRACPPWLWVCVWRNTCAAIPTPRTTRAPMHTPAR